MLPLQDLTSWRPSSLALTREETIPEDSETPTDAVDDFDAPNTNTASPPRIEITADPSPMDANSSEPTTDSQPLPSTPIPTHDPPPKLILRRLFSDFGTGPLSPGPAPSSPLPPGMPLFRKRLPSLSGPYSTTCQHYPLARWIRTSH